MLTSSAHARTLSLLGEHLAPADARGEGVEAGVGHRLLPLLLAGEEHDAPHEDQAARRHKDADTRDPEGVHREEEAREQEAEAEDDEDDEGCLDDPPGVSPPAEPDSRHSLRVRNGHTASVLSLHITDVPHLKLIQPGKKTDDTYMLQCNIATCTVYPNRVFTCPAR